MAEQPTPTRAQGRFDVKVLPIPNGEGVPAARFSRMSIDKVFHGDLQATSIGEMMAGDSGVEGSGVYVALEKVTGKLGGKSGSFMLHHNGVMTRGVPRLIVEVVPDSGTGELVGLTGRLDIILTADDHLYTFEYSLPA